MKLSLKLSYILIPIATVLIVIYLLFFFIPIVWNQVITVLLTTTYVISGWAFLIGLIAWFISRKEQYQLNNSQRKLRKYSLIIFVVFVAIISMLPFGLFVFGLAGPK